MKDLNVRQETIKTLEEKAGKNLLDLSCRNFLLDTFPKARELKAKMNYWDLIKIKNFCTAKETINKTKRQPNRIGKDWTKGYCPKSIKSSRNSTPEKQIIQ